MAMARMIMEGCVRRKIHACNVQGAVRCHIVVHLGLFKSVDFGGILKNRI